MPQGLGAASQWLGLSGSEDDQNRALGQIKDPNQAAFNMPGAAGLQQGYKDLQNGGVAQNFAGTQPGQNAQNDAMGLAGGLARGQGPSLSRENMNMGMAQGAANINSMGLASAQGGLGMRNALNALGAQQGQAAGAGSIAGAQEQIGNIQNYGALGSAARGQGIQEGTARTNAALGTLQGGSALAQTLTGNQMAYDAALRGQGNVRSDAITGQNHDAAAGAGKVLDTGIKMAGAAAGAVVPVPKI